jgi:hypothetical protein
MATYMTISCAHNKSKRVTNVHVAIDGVEQESFVAHGCPHLRAIQNAVGDDEVQILEFLLKEGCGVCCLRYKRTSVIYCRLMLIFYAR